MTDFREEMVHTTLLTEDKETVKQKAKRVLKGFHSIGVDKEVKLKDFEGVHGQINAEVYLLNTGMDVGGL